MNGTILGVEANQVRVGGREVEPILVHSDTAIANMVAFGMTFVVPNQPAKSSVDGPNIVGNREVENAVNLERRGLDPNAMCAECPGESQR